MRKENFGAFLNTWGRSLATYGSSVLKFVEKGDDLIPMVMPWQTIIIDAVDFEGNNVIEILQLTPAQLRQREGYDQEVVEALIDTKTSRELNDGQNKDNKSNYIKLYEIHGNLPKSYLTGDDEDEKTYVQQMHVVSFVEGKSKGEFDDFTLVSGKEKKNPYMITHLIKEDGRSQSIGSVEYLFDAQWMQNHTTKQIKDHLDLASKLIFQTSDPTFVGQNALEAIETGDILVHAPNSPLTQANNSSHDIGAIQAYGQQWKALGNEIVGISEAMQGAAPKAGTAWRQTEAILQENHDLFELMTENKGFDVELMFREFVIPYIVRTQLSNKDEIMATLEAHDIEKIDSKYIKVEQVKKVKQDFKELLAKGQLPVSLDLEATEESIRAELSEQGNVRSLVPSDISDIEWKEYFKDMQWDLEIDVTGEERNTQEAMTTINTILQTTAANPQAFEDPRFSFLVNKALNMTGSVSPIELAQFDAIQAPPQPEVEQVQPEVGATAPPLQA